MIAIILENAGGGSSNAAPVVRQIMDYYLLQRLPQIAVLQSNTKKSAVENSTKITEQGALR